MAFSNVLYSAPNATTACRIEASEWLSWRTLRVQNSESKEARKFAGRMRAKYLKVLPLLPIKCDSSGVV